MFITGVTSYAFMANSILQILFKSVLFFPKACSVLVSVLTWIMFHWRCYQTYIFIGPFPHWEPSLFSAEQEVTQCMHNPLAQSQPQVFSHPKALGRHRYSYFQGSPLALQACHDFPQLWPSPLHTWERLIPLRVLLSGQRNVLYMGFSSLHSQLALSKWVLTLTAY